MRKIFCMLVTVYSFAATSAHACTDEEFKALDRSTTEIQKQHIAEKSAQLDNYLQQIKARKNLSDKELFVYRTNILNHPKAKKLFMKERKLTFEDVLRLSAEKDCKKLQKWFDESMKSVNKQWDIVFAELEKEVNTQSSIEK